MKKIVIDIHEEMYDWLDNGFPDEDDFEKLWQVVKNGTPLEQAPCTDAISREAVLNEIYNTDGISNIYFCLADKINALPPVKPAEKLEGDLISRKDLLSWLDSTLEHSDKMFDSEIATLKAIKDKVENMPLILKEVTKNDNI